MEQWGIFVYFAAACRSCSNIGSGDGSYDGGSDGSGDGYGGWHSTRWMVSHYLPDPDTANSAD